MDNSIRLALPYIMPSQAQKHVTHNEALRMLDALVQPCVETTPTDIPPEEPQEGMVYAINGSPNGEWANHANSLAAYQDGTWFYFSPIKGWQFLAKDDMEKITFDGAKWISTSSVGLGEIDSLGINTSSDDNNRLTVESPNSLFSHEGESHQMKINKASEENTASLVFQSDFSSRAEIGLVGDDDLVFKTSSNGHDYTDLLRANSASGKVQINNLGINKMPDTNLHVYTPTSTATLRVQSGTTGTYGSPFADLSHDGSSFYVSNWGGGNIAFTAVRTGTSVTFGTSGQTKVRINDTELRPEQDNVLSLGKANKRWTEVWATNGVIQTSDKRDKKIHHRLYGSGKFVDHVEPIAFNWNDDDKSAIANAGFIAQEIDAAQSALGYKLNTSGKTEEGHFWIKPDQLLAVLWEALRETRQNLEEVKLQLSKK